MTNNQIKIYVGCALTDAPETFVAAVDKLKSQLRSEGFYVYDFVGVVKGTARDVFNWDIMYCVYSCDVFVAVCDEPSIGLGWELAEAAHFKKPVLAVARQDAHVTRMILGAAELEPHVQFERYQQLSDILPSIRKLADAAAQDKASMYELMGS